MLQAGAVPYARMDSIFDLSRCLSSTMGRAVNAESIVAIVSTATSFGHVHVAMRRVLQAPWVPGMRLELGGHRHCRGALARVQPATCSHITLGHLTAHQQIQAITTKVDIEIRCFALIIYLIYLRCSPG